MPRNDNKPRTGNFEDYLIETLRDPELASEYLNAAIEGGDHRVFIAALDDVVKANKAGKE